MADDYGQAYLKKVMGGNHDRDDPPMQRAKSYYTNRMNIHNKVAQHEGEAAQSFVDSVNKKRYQGND